MSSNKTPPVLPTAIDRYQVRALLGSGTFGTVYRAFDSRLDREVALKVLRPEMTTSEQAVERFLREAKAAAKLFHPHIVPDYDAGRAGTEFYIASAFIQGKTLAATIPEWGMEVHRAVELAVQLALALGYAHRQGVLHRDVKPQNIMVDEQGSLYLMDFGLAAWVQEEGTRLTQEGAMLGTPAYMSPEQAAGDIEKVGPAADLYSVGVVLYELLTGRRPFEGHTAALVFQVMSKAAAPPSRHRPGLDAGLDAVCLKALAKAPAERYRSGEDMAAALRGVALPVRKNGAVTVTSKDDVVVTVEATSPPRPAPAKAPFSEAEAKRLQQAWADFLGVPVEREVKLGGGATMKLQLIPPGRFTMSSPPSEAARYNGDEGPQHEVEITRPFYIGGYPVTKGQFAAFVNDNDYQTEAEKKMSNDTWRNPHFVTKYDQSDDDPVVEVSWNDTAKFCAWLSQKQKNAFELPTEAEWECASRAGTLTAFSFGDDPKALPAYAWYEVNSSHHTHPVGEKKPNPWGLYDLHGNVGQWCADHYTGIGEDHVFRGGWWDGSQKLSRSAQRNHEAPTYFVSGLGFRVVLRLGAVTP